MTTDTRAVFAVSALALRWVLRGRLPQTCDGKQVLLSHGYVAARGVDHDHLGRAQRVVWMALATRA